MVTLIAGLVFVIGIGGVVVDERQFTVHLIEHYSEKYGVDTREALEVAWCESRFNNVPSIHKDEDSFGIFQEQSSWWTKNAKRFGAFPDPKMRKYVEANIQLAMQVASVDGWKSWSCRPGLPVIKQQKKELDAFLSGTFNA